MLALMDAKTHSASVRIPADLFDRLEKIKGEQAHKRVPNSEFLVEAVRLYVELAETFGINDDLQIKETIGSYRPAHIVHEKPLEKKRHRPPS